MGRESVELSKSPSFFMRGEKLINLLINDTKKRKIHWKLDTQNFNLHLMVFTARWKKGITIKLTEEHAYVSLMLCSARDHVTMFNAVSDPSLNTLFSQVQNSCLEKDKVLNRCMIADI